MDNSLLGKYKTDIQNMIGHNEGLEKISAVIKSASFDLNEDEFITFNVYVLVNMRQLGYDNGVSFTKEEMKRLINEEL